MVRDAFAFYHPIVNIVYFTAVIGYAMFFLHPILLGISFLCAAVYALLLKGKKAFLFGLVFMLPLLLFTAAMNPLFNHQGSTILSYLPNGNPVTWESVLYGVAAAGMLVTVIAWFVCFNAVITSDKMVYLFGRAMPALSLVLSLALRFVPRLIAQAKVINKTQKGMGQKNNPIKTLSILVTWALENAIETADTMKARGYGLPGRTAFSLFTFRRRDGYAIAFISFCAVIVFIGAAVGSLRFRYFPTVQYHPASAVSVLTCIAYLMLCAFPIIMNMKEALHWKYSVSTV
ncbi:MAG: energy-coupling factor transporter transmembrane protein EcfT [Defluviitaleaceae bacterium]|nr:energy-coupling factor transporter transmembrane protein EcfT [Defluviitaleaceae bacterium]